PDTWVDWNWRNWRRGWGATTTMRGSWWSGTITEAACWRTSEMPADTRRFTARGATQRRAGVADNVAEPAGGSGTAGCGASRGDGAVHELEAAGRVQKLCAAAKWELGSAGGDAR